MMEEWKIGIMEEWNNGRMEEWKAGMMEDWNNGGWKNESLVSRPIIPFFHDSNIPKKGRAWL